MQSVVVTKGVRNNFDVALASIAALEVRMLVCPQRVPSFCYVCWPEFICSNRLKSVMFLLLELLLRML